MNKDEQRRELMLNGSIFKTIFIICFPLFIYHAFDTVYTIIDSIVVASINPLSVSAVACIGQIQKLLSSIGGGLAGGGGIMIARYFGAKDDKTATKYVSNLFIMSVFTTATLYLICIPFARNIMHLTGVPDELIAIGYNYFIVQIITLGFSFFNSIFIAIQKAKGSTNKVLYFNLLSMGVKLALTIFFVYGMHQTDIMYVAIATMVGQCLISIIGACTLFDKKQLLFIDLHNLKFDYEHAVKIITISFPIFLGKFIFAFGKVGVNALCKSYGALVVGALGISDNLSGIVTSPVNSFEEGLSGIISSNLGNHNRKRALQIFVCALVVALSISVVGYVLVRFTFKDQLISLFMTSKNTQDTEIFRQYIDTIFKYASLAIPALAVNACVLGLLYGFGQTKLSMVLNISRVFLFRIPLLYYFKTFHADLGVEAVGISMGLSNICIAIMSVIFLLIFLHNDKEKNYE